MPTVEKDPAFWEWLRDKSRQNNQVEDTGWKPIPLELPLVEPPPGWTDGNGGEDVPTNEGDEKPAVDVYNDILDENTSELDSVVIFRL